jgi:hypothetical protein
MSANLQDIIKRARSDAQFFHDLAFDPKKAAEQIGDQRLKTAILGLSPNAMFGQLARSIGLQWCGETCGSSSCIDTCGAHSCDNTCSDSCGSTCSWSCGDTSKFVGRISEVGLPERR